MIRIKRQRSHHPLESYKCRSCRRKHHVVWKDVIERIFECEKFQKTAEYVSELLAPHGKTLSTDPCAHGYISLYDCFELNQPDERHILHIVRWWCFLYYNARRRGSELCMGDITSKVVKIDACMMFPPYDESRVLFGRRFFTMLVHTLLRLLPQGNARREKFTRNFQLFQGNTLSSIIYPLCFRPLQNKTQLLTFFPFK